MLRRGRLLPASETEDCLRFCGLSRGEAGAELSGTTTAEAMTLRRRGQWARAHDGELAGSRFIVRHDCWLAARTRVRVVEEWDGV